MAPLLLLPSVSAGTRAQGGESVPQRSGFRPPDRSQQVLFDEPGDGALWALGGNSYKARFDSTSTTYFPRFGAEVPKHYPLSFVLEEVRVGGEQLEFERGVQPERQDSTVLFDRGSLVEFYELRPDSMEQKFLLEALPAHGELVLRIAAQTELAVLQTAAGFELANEHGRVGYSRAVALDNLGRAGETTTSFADGGIEIRVAASFLAEAAWPVTIDPVVAHFGIAPDAGADALAPDIAYDATNDRYAVVWEEAFSATDHDVYSMLLSSSGAVVPASQVSIDFTSDCWTDPKVANNNYAARFLTVCETSPDCDSPRDIRGRSRAAGSTAMGSQFLLSPDMLGDKVLPDVGGDPTADFPSYFCVVWQRILSATDSDIHYQLVKADDSLYFASTQFVSNSAGTKDILPSVSNSNGQGTPAQQRWTVVWARTLGSSETDVHGAQLAYNGAIVQPPFPIDVTASGMDLFPHVSSLLPSASAEREYMVVFQRGNIGDSQIMGRVFRGAMPLTPTTSLTELEGPIYSGQADLYPSVDADANSFTVIHAEQAGVSTTDYDITAGSFRYSVGTGRIRAEEAHVYMATQSDVETMPQIVSHQSGSDGAPALPRRYGAAWVDVNDPGTGDGDVEGAVYESLSMPGIPLCFGDGSVTPCPCGNTGASDRGCANSVGTGARLLGTGSNLIDGLPLRLMAQYLPLNQPGLFFQATNFVAGGAGTAFGDGLRCCGGNVVRLEVANSGMTGFVLTTVDVASEGGVQPGDTRCYQYWYRDPNSGPCGSSYNLSNAYEVTWR